MTAFSQDGFGVRFEWGLAGADVVDPATAALVVVDVLSFTTAVTVAAARGTARHPHRWPSPEVESFALERQAVYAVRRQAVDADHPWSLSPAHIRSAPLVDRLVLPSPNGSAIAAAGPTVLWSSSPQVSVGRTPTSAQRSKTCLAPGPSSPPFPVSLNALLRPSLLKSHGTSTETTSTEQSPTAHPGESSSRPASPSTSPLSPSLIKTAPCRSSSMVRSGRRAFRGGLEEIGCPGGELKGLSDAPPLRSGLSSNLPRRPDGGSRQDRRGGRRRRGRSSSPARLVATSGCRTGSPSAARCSTQRSSLRWPRLSARMPHRWSTWMGCPDCTGERWPASGWALSTSSARPSASPSSAPAGCRGPTVSHPPKDPGRAQDHQCADLAHGPSGRPHILTWPSA